MYTYICMYIYTHIYIHRERDMHIHVYIYISIYIYIYTHMYIHVYSYGCYVNIFLAPVTLRSSLSDEMVNRAPAASSKISCFSLPASRQQSATASLSANAGKWHEGSGAPW